MDNEQLANISMQIITFAGVAKSIAIEAIRKARECKNEAEISKETQAMLHEARENLKTAAKSHVDVLQKEAQGLGGVPTVLFMHAEDQMLSTETIIALAEEIIELTKMVITKK